MPMDIDIHLNDDDLQFFVNGMRGVEASIAEHAPDEIIAAAQQQLATSRGTSVPPFIAERLQSVESMISMAKDVGFGLSGADRQRVLAALAYLVNPNDVIPDSVPVLGYLDDAIMIELCRHDLRFEIEAYDDFSAWREQESRVRGEDPANLVVRRVDWADARATEAIARMHRRRSSSYASGAWKPALFTVG